LDVKKNLSYKISLPMKLLLYIKNQFNENII